MACGVYVFSHDKPTGSAPAHRLFERIQVVRREGIAHLLGDYLVTADEADLPEGITLSVGRMSAAPSTQQDGR